MRVVFYSCLMFITLGMSVPTYAQITHSVSVGTGYALSLKDGNDQDYDGRTESLNLETGEVLYRDARPRLAEGLQYNLNYNMGFRNGFSLETNIYLLNGVEWTRTLDYEGGSPVIDRTRADSYGFRAYAAYDLLHDKKYDRWDFWENSTLRIYFGGGLFRSFLYKRLESLEQDPQSSAYYVSDGRLEGGLGYLLGGGLSIGNRLSRNFEVSLDFKADYAFFYPEYRRRTYSETSTFVDESTTIVPVEGLSYPFSNVTVGLSLHYLINP